MTSFTGLPFRIFNSQRCFHTTHIKMCTQHRLGPKSVQEVKIPTPWGHIAGRYYLFLLDALS